MLSLQTGLLLSLLAFVVTTLVYPQVLRFAIKHNIVDNPNARKLQRVPVPVMGGTAVFIGFVFAVAVAYFLSGMDWHILIMLCLVAVMYAIGVWDDVKDVSAALRFMVEIIIVWMMILLLNVEINDFHGLWGKDAVSDVVSLPLSIVAGVGIMNAVNLIDGVDGYCSSYGVMTCAAFAFIFYRAGDMAMFSLALIAIGAFVPFFFHNVFGRTSKMFLGDGGSLMLGTLLTLFTFTALTTNSPCKGLGDNGLSLVALTLAILAVPVFDTLKVMIFRVLRRQSPFHPDKTHLHHLFIELGFTHLATSFIIVFTNAFIIGALILVWALGASIDFQVYFVIGLSLLFTWGFYFFMESQRLKRHGLGSNLYQFCRRFGERRLYYIAPFWRFTRRIVDSRLLGGAPEAPKPASPSTPVKLDPRIK